MQIDYMEFIKNAIVDASFVGLSGGVLVWFFGWCISKILSLFKTLSN